MKLPSLPIGFAKKKPVTREYVVSLVLATDHVAAAAWTIERNGKPEYEHAVSKKLSENSWDERIKASDQVISAIEARIETHNISKVVLGLPSAFLTAAGAILDDERKHLKRLTTDLELTPVGFVPIHQAIAYKLKKDEGVPPTVILLGVTADRLTISLFRVGQLILHRDIKRSETEILEIEKTLKNAQDIEVLPSRILLYGANKALLEDMCGSMTKHPWTGRVHFLHFPKIDILPADVEVTSISLAGAKEMGTAVTLSETDTIPEKVTKPQESQRAQSNVTMDEIPETSNTSEAPEDVEDEIDEDAEVGDSEEDDSDESDENIIEATVESDVSTDRDVPGEEDVEEIESDPGVSYPTTADAEESNVTFVAPEALGFSRSHDVKDFISSTPRTKIHNQPQENESSGVRGNSFKHPITQPKKNLSQSLSGFSDYLKRFAGGFKSIPVPHGGKYVAIIGGIFVLVAVLIGILLYVLPKANVTIMTKGQPVTQEMQITIDPEGTQVDLENKIIPAQKIQKVIKQEKVMPVTGKKKVGEPAKGTVTLYNKSLVGRTIKKGAQITSGSLVFAVNSDVTIASASETIGSITFAKENVSVTAKDIGTQGNLAAGSEFALKDISTSAVVGRNDQPLTGGTSREVTVVTRADYDGLVTSVTSEVSKIAQEELQANGEGLTLIADSITSAVTSKDFKEELDEETKELHGTVEVTVSGLAYTQGAVSELVGQLLKQHTPSGYELPMDKANVTFANTKTAKDGKVTGLLKMDGNAQPVIDNKLILSKISGKSLTEAREFLKSLTGVTDAEISVSAPIMKNRLPRIAGNISFTVAGE